MKIKRSMFAILFLVITGICQATILGDEPARNTGMPKYSGSLQLGSIVNNTGDISGYSGRRININTGEHRFTDRILSENPQRSIKITRTIFMGIKEIRWSEKGDKPCSMLVRTRALDLTIDKTGYESVSLCGSNSSEKKVEFRNRRYFLRGIAACTTNKKSSSKNRLKGIRIYPARVAASGTVTNINTFEEERRHHCDTWFPPVFCSDGEIASGVNIYYEDDVFRGLGLRCRSVERLDSVLR